MNRRQRKKRAKAKFSALVCIRTKHLRVAYMGQGQWFEGFSPAISAAMWRRDTRYVMRCATSTPISRWVQKLKQAAAFAVGDSHPDPCPDARPLRG